MKYFLRISVYLLTIMSIVNGQNSATLKTCTEGIELNDKYTRALDLRSVLDRLAPGDLPGLSLAVYSEDEGWWAGASGYGRIESKTPMTICNMQYLQSVSKTYMAVAILRLYQEKKIVLDDPITNYLPRKHTINIRNANKITVRMLLNHTSGIAEYITHPGYVAYVFMNPTKVYPVEEALKLLKKEEAQFAPGSKYRYTNTNYLLLAMIGDIITGDHAGYIAKHIFKPLGLTQSRYHPSKTQLEYAGLPDSYWDALSSGRYANITVMQKANVSPLKGDDGVIATPLDAVKFLKGLMEGRLLKDSTLKLMKQWVNNDEGKPAYGLGLIQFDLDGSIAYGHGGGGLGAGCILAYVPSKKVYFFLATNTGVVIDGLGGIKANDAKNAIVKVLLK